MPIISQPPGSQPAHVGHRRYGIYSSYSTGPAALPRTFPAQGNLNFWFDSRFITQSGGVLTAYLDQSSNGVTQTQIGSPSIQSATFNGIDTVQYSSTAATQLPATNYYNPSNPFTILVAGRVLSSVAGGGYGLPINIRGAIPDVVAAFYFEEGANNVKLTITVGQTDAGGGISTIYTTKVYADINSEYLNNHWFVIAYDGGGPITASSYTIRVNNDSRATATAAVSGGLVQTNQFTGGASITPFMQVAMVAMWNIALSADELDQLGRYMYDYSAIGTPVSLAAPEQPAPTIDEFVEEPKRNWKAIGAAIAILGALSAAAYLFL